MESGGLVITKAIYGNQKVLRRREEQAEGDGELSQVIDVTLPLNFLVSDSGLLKVCHSKIALFRLFQSLLRLSFLSLIKNVRLVPFVVRISLFILIIAKVVVVGYIE